MTETRVRDERVSLLSRACETCRVRKTRCNKAIPCSNCQTLGVQCQPASKPIEQRPRMVVSSHYERQIEVIQERLHLIAKDIQVILRNSLDQDRVLSIPATSTTNQESPGDLTAFEGESSFSKETLQASRAASNMLGKNSNPAVISALSSLQENLSTVESSRRLHDAHLFDNLGRREMNLLPAGLVVALVKKGKVSPPLCAVASSWTNHGQLECLCQKIYFPVEELPFGAMALMHGMLCRVIQEFAQHDDPKFAGYNLEDCATLCERNFQQCLKSYESLIIPTLENTQTLLLAASQAQNESKLSLCWTYVSIAQTMCQTLGYHRESTYRNDTSEVAQTKRHAFYTLYIIDKNLSLVLGRTSNFNDNDIDTEPFALSTNPKQWPWDFYNHVSIRFAKIQGEVYDQLYSISTTKLSQHERSRSVEELSARISSLREELQSLRVSNACYSEVLQMTMESADFISYAVLTVVYRAETSLVNSVEISSRCYNAAKRSLECHLKCFAGLESCSIHQQIDYVKSTLLYPSFTPYVIVFTHAIATANSTDFILLQDIVKSLARFQDFSPGSRRLYCVCRSFLNTAEVLMGSRKSFDGLEQHEDGSLVFTTRPATAELDWQMASQGVPTIWDEPPIFSNTAASAATGSEGNSDLDTFNYWTSWLGSTKSVTDTLCLDFTDADMREPSGDVFWDA